MATDRQGRQLLLSLSGGVLLAVSVFLPWYSLAITQNGVAAAQQGLSNVAQQFGNSAFQSTATSLGNSFGSLVGKQFGTVSAHQALKYVSVVLLVLAGIAILVTMVRLLGAAPAQPRGLLAVVGFAAVVCIVFRMIERPAADQDVFAISLSWGAYLALASAVAVIAGDLWPRRTVEAAPAAPSYPSQPFPSGPSAPDAGGPSHPGGLSTPPRPPGWS
jgi:hypothetical protein